MPRQEPRSWDRGSNDGVALGAAWGGRHNHESLLSWPFRAFLYEVQEGAGSKRAAQDDREDGDEEQGSIYKVRDYLVR